MDNISLGVGPAMPPSAEKLPSENNSGAMNQEAGQTINLVEQPGEVKVNVPISAPETKLDPPSEAVKVVIPDAPSNVPPNGSQEVPLAVQPVSAVEVSAGKSAPSQNKTGQNVKVDKPSSLVDGIAAAKNSLIKSAPSAKNAYNFASQYNEALKKSA